MEIPNELLGLILKISKELNLDFYLTFLFIHNEILKLKAVLKRPLTRKDIFYHIKMAKWFLIDLKRKGNLRSNDDLKSLI